MSKLMARGLVTLKIEREDLAPFQGVFAYAERPLELVRGLSGVSMSDLDGLEGMVLDMGSEIKSGVCNADMLFALDVLFLNEQGEVVDIGYLPPNPSRVPPKDELTSSDTPRTGIAGTVISTEPFRYVVEAPAGFIDAHRITLGTKFSIQHS